MKIDKCMFKWVKSLKYAFVVNFDNGTHPIVKFNRRCLESKTFL